MSEAFRQPKFRGKRKKVTTAGAQKIAVTEKSREELVSLYRPFASAKAIRWIAEASHDFAHTADGKTTIRSRYEQYIPVDEIKAMINTIPDITEVREGGIQFTDVGMLMLSEIDKLADLTYATMTAQEHEIGLETIPIHIGTLVDRYTNLFKRNKIDTRTYLKFIDALKMISASPEITKTARLHDSNTLSMINRAEGMNLFPTGFDILLSDASFVNSFLNQIPSTSRDIVEMYARLATSRKDKTIPESDSYLAYFISQFKPENQEVVKQLFGVKPEKRDVNMIIRMIRDAMAERNFSQNRTNFAYSPPVGTSLSDTDEMKAGERFMAAINMYHTQKKVPVVASDLIESIEQSPRMTSEYKELAIFLIGKAKSKYMSDVAEARKTRSRVFEDVVPEDPNIIPSESVADAFLGWFTSKAEIATKEKKEVAERSKVKNYIEMKYLLAKEIGVLMSQVHKQWPIRGIERLEDKTPLYIFGNGVFRSAKAEKKMTAKDKEARDKEEHEHLASLKLSIKKQEEEDLKTNAAAKKIELERDFGLWIESMKTSGKTFDMAKEHLQRVDAPVASFIVRETKLIDSRVSHKMTAAEMEAFSDKRLEKISNEDLERNAVELARDRARARAADLQRDAVINWRTVRKADFETARPFVVNAYMREARLEQANLIEKIITEIKRQGLAEEYRDLLSDLGRKAQHIKMVSNYADKKEQLDNIWKMYERRMYAPPRLKSLLERLKNLVSDEKQKKVVIQMISWLDIPQKISPDDLFLPKIDTKEFASESGVVIDKSDAMEYPLSKERLYNEMKPFRLSEDTKIAELATEIQAKLVNAENYDEIGPKRNELNEELSRLRRNYDKIFRQAKALDPKNPDKLARLLSIRYEDDYIAPEYAMDAFGVLSLMESGMLEVSKKPSEFLREYLAMGRMLDPAFTFPEVAKDGTLPTYEVLPSMAQIAYEIDNVHPLDSIQKWAKSEGANGLIDLSKSGIIDPYLADIALRKVEAKDVSDAYVKYETTVLNAKAKASAMADVIYTKKDNIYVIDDLFKTKTEEMPDKTIQVSIPALQALMATERNDEQNEYVRKIEEKLKKSGFADLEIGKADLIFVLANMIGNEDDFTHNYNIIVSERKKMLDETERRRASLAKHIAIRNVIPEAGPYLSDLIAIALNYEPDVTEENIGKVIDSVYMRLLAKMPSERSEQEASDLSHIRKTMKDISSLKAFRESAKLLEIIGVPKDSDEYIVSTTMRAEAYTASLKLRQMAFNMLRRERSALRRARKRALQKLLKAKVPREEAEKQVLEKVTSDMKPELFFSPDSSYESFVKNTALILENLTTTEYLNTFRDDLDAFYTKSLRENIMDRILKANPDMSKEKAEKVMVDTLNTVRIGQNMGAFTAAEMYIHNCEQISQLMTWRENDISLVAYFFKDTGLSLEELESKIAFDKAKALKACVMLEDTKRILAEKRAEKKIMSFLGTPFQHQHQMATRKAAEAFFGINELLEKRGYEVAS